MNLDESYFLLVDKPAGMTSQYCLTQIKRAHKFIKKIGHHGTLDPFATGLMLVGINEATKFFRFIDDSQKTYEATLKLGSETDTLDCDGKIVLTEVVPDLDREFVKTTIEAFKGEMNQVPPMFSAVKIQGEKLYTMARRGETIEREARPVVIHDAQLLTCDQNSIKFLTTVSRGTYIRVYALDLAKRLGTIGHLKALRRTKVCGLDETCAQTLEDMKLALRPITMERLLRHYPQLEVTDQQCRNLVHGKPIFIGEHPISFQTKEGDQLVALFQGRVLGILKMATDGSWRSERLVDASQL